MPGWIRSTSLVGREGELQALLESRSRAASGRFSTVLLGGEAGVGKSRLVAEYLSRTVELDPAALAVQGNCLELAESVLPLAPLVGLLRDLSRRLGPEETETRFGPELARFLPGHTGHPPEDGWGQALL